jgi:hypothetical protein
MDTAKQPNGQETMEWKYLRLQLSYSDLPQQAKDLIDSYITSIESRSIHPNSMLNILVVIISMTVQLIEREGMSEHDLKIARHGVIASIAETLPEMLDFHDSELAKFIAVSNDDTLIDMNYQSTIQ